MVLREKIRFSPLFGSPLLPGAELIRWALSTMLHSLWTRTGSKLCCASFPFSIQRFKVLGYLLSTKMWAMPVHAPTSCPLPMLCWASEQIFSLLLQLHLLSSRAPPTALRSFFIYECIQLHCVCRSVSQPLPCRCPGTMLLNSALICREYGGELDPGSSHPWLPPAGVCRPDFHPQRTHTGVTEPRQHHDVPRSAPKVLGTRWPKYTPDVRPGWSVETLTTQWPLLLGTY